MKIALAGNPNSGKTTLFNAITGKTEYVGNWPGVTVEKKEANLKNKFIKNNTEVRIVDLPGAYSIAPYTSEEAITRDFITDEKLDVIINIVDGSNLERSLFFTTQLIELGIPVVIALNKQDIVNKHGDKIDINKLQKELKCSVIETVAKDNIGLQELIDEVIKIQKESIDKEENNVKVREISNDVDRKEYVKKIVQKSVVKKSDSSKLRLSDKIDRVVANPILGLVVFFVIMFGVYSLSIEGIGGFFQEIIEENLFEEAIPVAVESFFNSVGVEGFLADFVLEGIIGGVGAVLSFIPLIMVMFFLLGLLEDSGYLTRVAVVMDKYFKRIGLSGKSIIPMIVGVGCSIPGIMATRSIEDENEKRMTAILTPFIPCGAKLPIIGLFAAAFFSEASWVATSMYILAIVMVIIGGLILKKIFAWENNSMFIIELPEYKIPSIKHACKQMWKHSKGFIYKATTIILVCNAVVWVMQSYSWTLQPVEDPSLSILASVGGMVGILLIPLGFIGWQAAAATITGFIAKENVVATLTVILLVASEEALHVSGGELTTLFNPVTGYAFLVFNLFTPPCFAAIGAMNAELGSKKWLFKAIGFQMAVGYTLAMLITQIGTIVFYGELAQGFIASIIILVALVTFLVFRIKKSSKEAKKTYLYK